MKESNDPKNIVEKLLRECIITHEQRRDAYDLGYNVFEVTAKIFNAVIGKDVTAEEIAFMLLATKLARYGNLRKEIGQCSPDSDEFSELWSVIWDTVKDSMVYAALTERERQKIEDDNIKTIIAKKL
jgi:hypothetical protein